MERGYNLVVFFHSKYHGNHGNHPGNPGLDKITVERFPAGVHGTPKTSRGKCNFVFMPFEAWELQPFISCVFAVIGP